jgi:hypothetical protein
MKAIYAIFGFFIALPLASAHAMGLNTVGEGKTFIECPRNSQRITEYDFSRTCSNYRMAVRAEGLCSIDLGEKYASNGYSYKIKAEYQSSDGSAYETIEGSSYNNSGKRIIKITAQCNGNPWLTDASCNIKGYSGDNSLWAWEFNRREFPYSKWSMTPNKRAEMTAAFSSTLPSLHMNVKTPLPNQTASAPARIQVQATYTPDMKLELRYFWAKIAAPKEWPSARVPVDAVVLDDFSNANGALSGAFNVGKTGLWTIQFKGYCPNDQRRAIFTERTIKVISP